MRGILRRLVLLALAASLLCAAPASAEDCFTLDVDALDMGSLNSNEYVARNLTAQTQGLRVVKYISDSNELAAPVRLTLVRMDTNTLIFDKDYGYISGVFDSDAIYLPYVDSDVVPYLVTLYVADTVYAMPFMHMRARLSYNGGCTMGARLGDLDPALGQDWLMGTMIDLNELRAQGYRDIDVCASGAYIVGRLSVMLDGSQMYMQLGFYSAANVELNYYSLYVITDCNQLTTADVTSTALPSYTLGQPIDISGASSVLIYMPMQLSYDPAQSLDTYYYDPGSDSVRQQCWLFEQNRIEALNVGSVQTDAFEPDAPILYPDESSTEAVPSVTDGAGEVGGQASQEGYIDEAITDAPQEMSVEPQYDGAAEPVSEGDAQTGMVDGQDGVPSEEASDSLPTDGSIQ